MSTTPLGFRLSSLTLVGPSVEAASVAFRRGLNVVTGPSDTGKTFIAQCINFLVGGDPPKAIPEAQGYELARLELETDEGESLTLERSLRGGAFRLFRGGETTALAPKHNARDEKNVSRLLLALSGLDGRMVRKNARGTKRSMSFRDLAHVILVGEEAIIAQRSPILTGQHTGKTAETAVFRLLLTGSDDSAIVEFDEPKVAKGKQAGKQEVLEALLEQITKDIDDLGLAEVTTDQAQAALEEANEALAAARSKLAAERASASEIEDMRRSAWRALWQTESRASALGELQVRFVLLQQQYESDLGRLVATGEAGVRLAQMTEERCPVCGAVAEHHDRQHQEAHAAPADVAAACVAEADKIQVLARDLEVTIAKNLSELEQLEAERVEHQAQLQAAQAQLREEMEPKLSALVAELQEAQGRHAEASHLAELYRRSDGLQELLEEARKPFGRSNDDLPSAAVGADEAERFSKAAEDVLRSWRFPGLARVTFSENDQDVVISGRRRASHGKGVRALTHAAFTLALLAYCRKECRPHPGWVVIDSPLVVYREPDATEAGEQFKVKDAFYRSVASTFAADQVIILENEAPPADLRGANIIYFTKSERGRYGFLPASRSREGEAQS